MKFYLFSAIICALLVACKKDHDEKPLCAYSLDGQIRFVFAPYSAQVDSAIGIASLWETTTNCQKFNGFSESINGNIREVTIQTIVDTCNCDNSQLGGALLEYIFYSSTPGIQIVKTKTGPGIGFAIDTIVVY